MASCTFVKFDNSKIDGSLVFFMSAFSPLHELKVNCSQWPRVGVKSWMQSAISKDSEYCECNLCKCVDVHF